MNTDSLTQRIIRCAYTVGTVLGPGFLESVYENALMQELAASGLAVESQKSYHVHYRNTVVEHSRHRCQ